MHSATIFEQYAKQYCEALDKNYVQQTAHYEVKSINYFFDTNVGPGQRGELWAKGNVE